jgi:hypothetical protein
MSYQPVFKGPIEGWTVNYCTKNFWRVEGTQQMADLLQEAYIVYLRCSAKYPHAETPQHFMSLYMRAFSNQFTELARADTRHRQMAAPLPTDDEGQPNDSIGELKTDGDLAILLSQAPREVLMVLNLFLSAPTEIIELALAGWKGKDKRCLTSGSKKICIMLGLPKDLDVLQLVEDYFQPH